jgi:hypothetical protein
MTVTRHDMTFNMAWLPPYTVFALSILASLCSADSGSSSSDTSAAIIGAIGSVIGYLGGEVAEKDIFDRLLWPERFYNTTSLWILLKIALFVPMSGPVHSAALSALDSFRECKLYSGKRRGHMLRTPFYTNLNAKYYARTDSNSVLEKEARNALPIRILRLVKPPEETANKLNLGDTEAQQDMLRTAVFIHRLYIRYATQGDISSRQFIRVQEKFSIRTWLGLVFSEITAIIFAPVVGFRLGSWFGFWWLAPLLLKVIAVPFRVRREALTIKADDSSRSCMFQVVDEDDGIFLIEGPDLVVCQFFRHYGHPIRTGYSVISDRSREIVSMIIVALYGSIYLVGLLVTIWLDQTIQFVWLGFQLFITLAMLSCRLAGGSTSGTTEEAIANALSVGKEVLFEKLIVMKLETICEDKVGKARTKVAELVRAHSENRFVGPETIITN